MLNLILKIVIITYMKNLPQILVKNSDLQSDLIQFRFCLERFSVL